MSVLIDSIRSKGNQPAIGNKATLRINCGQLVPGRERDAKMTVNHCQWASCYDQACIRGACKGCKGVLDFADVAHTNRLQRNTE
jgi:hypothetical protein